MSRTSTGTNRATIPSQRRRASQDRQASQGAAATAGESVIRQGVGVVGLVAIALIHFLDLPGKLSETPYLGVMYMGLIASALVLAELLIRRDEILVWAGTGLLAVGAIIGFSLTRTVGLPGAMGDIGNWQEPLGLASLFVEAVVILLAIVAVARSAQLPEYRAIVSRLMGKGSAGQGE